MEWALGICGVCFFVAIILLALLFLDDEGITLDTPEEIFDEEAAVNYRLLCGWHGMDWWM